MIFTTPSGRGIKIIVETPNKDVDKYDNYLHNNYGIDYQYMDRLTPYHMAFISYDPNAKFNCRSKLFNNCNMVKTPDVQKGLISGYLPKIKEDMLEYGCTSGEM